MCMGVLHNMNRFSVKDLDWPIHLIIKAIWVVLIKDSLNRIKIRYYDYVWIYETMILPKGRSLCSKFTQGVIVDVYSNLWSMFVPKGTMLNCLLIHDLLVSPTEVNSLRIEETEQLWVLSFSLKWNNNGSTMLVSEKVKIKGLTFSFSTWVSSEQ